MKLQELTLNPAFSRFVMALSRALPEGMADGIARLAARAVARARPEIYWIVRANLSQVLGPDVDASVLHAKTRRVFYHAMRNYYDLYRRLHLPADEMSTAVDFDEPAQELARTLLASGRGIVLVMAHLGNFDLLMRALGTFAPEIQVLTLPNPAPGFERMNELRRGGGLQITPLSPAALRQALRLLKKGGVVGVAGDRPVSELDEPFPFFGRPARVPSGHVRLALKTDAIVITGYCAFVPETRRYLLDLAPPVEMVHHHDPDACLHLNMRRVLDSLEIGIRRWPEQWQMFVPVWPELLRTGG